MVPDSFPFPMSCVSEEIRGQHWLSSIVTKGIQIKPTKFYSIHGSGQQCILENKCVTYLQITKNFVAEVTNSVLFCHLYESVQ